MDKEQLDKKGEMKNRQYQIRDVVLDDASDISGLSNQLGNNDIIGRAKNRPVSVIGSLRAVNRRRLFLFYRGSQNYVPLPPAARF